MSQAVFFWGESFVLRLGPWGRGGVKLELRRVGTSGLGHGFIRLGTHLFLLYFIHLFLHFILSYFVLLFFSFPLCAVFACSCIRPTHRRLQSDPLLNSLHPPCAPCCPTSNHSPYKRLSAPRAQSEVSPPSGESLVMEVMKKLIIYD